MRLTFLLFACLWLAPGLAQEVSPAEKEQINAEVRRWILNKTLDSPATYVGEEFYEYEQVIELSPEAERAHSKWIDEEFNALKLLFEDSAYAKKEVPDSIKMRMQTLEDKYHGYEKEHMGYKVKHKFRAKSVRGDHLFYEGEFIMDKQFRMQETSVKERRKSTEKTG